ncbi:MAG: AMIN domain-containing protein, partial [Deltaproteobacteria bacterium]
MTLTIRAIFLLLCISLASPAQLLRAADGEKPADAQQTPASYLISAIDAAPTADGYAIRISGNREPAYTKFELVNPLRIVLDIADASISDSVHLPMTMDKGPVSKIAIGQQGKNSSATRLQFFMAADPDYKVSREANDIVVAFTGDMKKIGPEKSNQKVKLTSIDIKKDAGETVVHLRANGPLSDYKYAELPASKTNPARLYIDLKNVNGDDIDKVISVGGTLAKIRTAQRGSSMRLVFDAKGKSIFNYQIDKRADGLDVKIADSAST